MLGLYGGDDARVNATVGPAQEEMKRLGKRYEVETYEKAGHAFLRQQDGREGANLLATQKAWPRMVQFLRQALSSQSTLSVPGSVRGGPDRPVLRLRGGSRRGRGGLSALLVLPGALLAAEPSPTGPLSLLLSAPDPAL